MLVSIALFLLNMFNQTYGYYYFVKNSNSYWFSSNKHLSGCWEVWVRRYCKLCLTSEKFGSHCHYALIFKTWNNRNWIKNNQIIVEAKKKTYSIAMEKIKTANITRQKQIFCEKFSFKQKWKYAVLINKQRRKQNP